MLLQGGTWRKNGGKKYSTPSSGCDVDMCRTGFHKKVIVWLNCAQRIVTVVGSEVRVLPESLGRALPLCCNGSTAVITLLSHQLPIITPGSVSAIQRR